MSQTFKEAFTLLKTGDGDTISLDDIFSFTDTLTPAPSHDKVRAIYHEFDADGSGDIDSEEFLGLCQALEKLMSMSVDAMAECYSSSCYRRLFALVDDGSGPLEEATISKDELKVFLDSSALQVSSADIVNIFKDYSGELRFDDFRQVVKRLIRGKSIALVVRVFEEGKARQRQNRLAALKMFENPTVAKRKAAREEEAQLISQVAKVSRNWRSQTSEEVFKECFTLMDSRGGGVLSLESIVDFCDALPKPPNPATVRKLYNQFDADGSGDIDSEEFLGFCKALEAVVGLTTATMCQHYSDAMYRRLFKLVDEEGGDGNETISKDELKVLLEAISPLLSSSFTTADIFALVKDVEGELGFEEFCDVVRRLTVGKSISQVVAAFNEAVRLRKSGGGSGMDRGVDRGGSGGRTRAFGAPGGMDRLCFACMEKEQHLREMQQEIDILRAELAQLKGGAAAASQEKSIRELINEDDLRGDPFVGLHSVQDLSGAPFYKKFPELVKPALYHTQNARVAKLVEFFAHGSQGGATAVHQTDLIAREINEGAPAVAEMQAQLMAVLDPLHHDYSILQSLLRELLQQIVAFNDTPDVGVDAMSETFDLAQSYRANMKAMRGEVSWVLDLVVAERAQLANKALCIAPFTSKTPTLTASVERCEAATQKMLDLVTVVLMHGSDQLSDVEITAKRIIKGVSRHADAANVEAMQAILSKLEEATSKQQLADAMSKLSKSLEVLQRNVSVSSSTKKDKAVMTLPLVDQPILLPRVATKHVDASAGGDRGDATTMDRTLEALLRTQSPRMRTKTAKPRNAVAHVDHVLEDYILGKGVEVPRNFRRVEPGSNTFAFGTKKIEVVPVDKFAVVKVGGGYLMFDEFCNKYCESENRRFVVQEHKPQIEVIRSYQATPRVAAASTGTPRSVAAASGGGAVTPRSGVDTPRTPRTLVRSGNKLRIV